MIIQFTILGEVPSMKNSRAIMRNPKTGRPMLIKSEAARNYERDASRQIPHQAKQNLEGELWIHVACYYKTERHDLDAELLFDILQSHTEKSGDRTIITRRGVYVNDRQLRSKHLDHYISKNHPRVIITIKPREEAPSRQQLFNDEGLTEQQSKPPKEREMF